MIDIEESALGAFEENLRFAPHRVVQFDDGICDEWLQLITGGTVRFVNFFE